MNANTNPALQLEGLTLAFGAHIVLKEITMSAMEGEFIAIVGPTGCGKSSLLNSIAGLHPPLEGSITLFDSASNGVDLQIGYLFQQDSLFPWKSALDNVAAGLVFRGSRKSDAQRQAELWLAKVGLTGFERHYPHQLSGGMKKRVALAQVLILEPKVLLMDEPFSALDVQTRNLMENELLRLWQQDRKSVLFVTHDLEEALTLADRVVVLSAGPSSRVIGDFSISLPRPRDVSEIRLTEPFLDHYREIWGVLREEVLRAHVRQQ